MFNSTEEFEKANDNPATTSLLQYGVITCCKYDDGSKIQNIIKEILIVNQKGNLMENKINDKIIAILEDSGWIVSDNEDQIYIETHSPAGEHLITTLCKENLIENLKEYCTDFDPEEHAEELIIAKHNGLQGVPSVRTLIEDADAIKEMLDKLVSALSKIE